MSRIQEPRYLFTRLGLAALHGFVDEETLFAFDLDGTLTPIADDPESIVVSQETKKELAVLMKNVPVGIITGRSRRDALKHLRIRPRFLVGNHGAEGLPGYERREREFTKISEDWERQLNGLLNQMDAAGISIENKGATLSVHYRAAPDPVKARSTVLRAVNRLVPRPRRVEGKRVENLLPETAPDKGTAMLRMMATAKCAKGFYVGDDVTDEDVFRHGGSHLLTVSVGPRMSQAQYFVRRQGEVVRLLREINEHYRSRNVHASGIEDPFAG